MEIEHKLVGAQVKYGYIWWSKNYEKYEEIFPNNKFKIQINDKEIINRKISSIGKKKSSKDNEGSYRVYIGTRIMDRKFNENDIILISRDPSSNVVKIRKKK